MKFDFRTIKRSVFVLVMMTIIFAYMQVVFVEQRGRYCDFRFRLSRSLEFQNENEADLFQSETTREMNVVYYDDNETDVKDYEDEFGENSEENSTFNDLAVLPESDSNSKVESIAKHESPNLDLQRGVMNKTNTTDFTEKPLMILFSSWTYSNEKSLVHSVVRNNWKSWASIKPMVLTRDHKVQTECRNDGWMVHGISDVNKYCNGPPVLSTMFTDLYRKHDAYFYGYSNADIVFGNGLQKTMEFLFHHFSPWKTKPILVVGRRYNVDFVKYRNESWKTPDDVKNMAKHGKLVIRSTDYFFTNKLFPWGQTPKVSIGRPYVVRAIIAWALKKGYFVIDATRTIESVHLTTLDGVFASWHTKGVMCNQRIMSELHWSVPLGIGHCECARLETFHGQNGTIGMRHRPPSKTICSK